MIEERNGQCIEVEYGAGCDDCFGLGAHYGHEPSCESDFCVGNGDEYSCNGGWVPCYSCATVRVIR